MSHLPPLCPAPQPGDAIHRVRIGRPSAWRPAWRLARLTRPTACIELGWAQKRVALAVSRSSHAIPGAGFRVLGWDLTARASASFSRAPARVPPGS
jgi:hypothetical protein